MSCSGYYRFAVAMPAVGPVAQWLELTAHNRLVAGSSPAGPTNMPVYVQHDFAEPLSYRGWKEIPAYVSAEHALTGLTKSVAIEWAP
jgi:NAD(P)-dependent dehydrogenase (short-subunit alcohol dehydrogenase family)